ncbi:GIY-YIG nuclease family protein [Streptomyces sp. NPDC002120]|uniref:GIY-YIG nuclease family protein n=1 Tax=Streptomyces sp. NPDC002120 TaxID=3364631 RepID=UPI00369B3EEF
MRNDADEAVAAMRAAGLEPLEPYPGSAFPWKSRCTRCDAVVSPRLGSMAAGSRRPGCKPCADKANGIAQRHDENLAVEEMRAHGFEPQEPYRSVKYPWRCLCHGCGTITSPTFGSILAGQSGCRRCADLRAGAARREDPERAAASMREAGLEPLEPYTGAMRPWRCRCTTCGRASTPTLAKIRSGRRCKYCARHGFDRAAPARVYVLTHAGHLAVKIGVAGASQRNERIAQHGRYGWTLFYEHHLPTGDDALTVEQAILHRLRTAGHKPFLTAAELPNGWTETFNAQHISATNLRDTIRDESRALPRCPGPLTLF